MIQLINTDDMYNQFNISTIRVVPFQNKYMHITISFVCRGIDIISFMYFKNYNFFMYII